MKVTIDESAGFCWGVLQTIRKVDDCLDKSPNEKIYVLGEIIHNPREIERLEKIGLETIRHKDLEDLPSDSKVIIRAHGEPPSTYNRAEELGVNLIDATCALVKSLQQVVKNYFLRGYQIIIFGKRDHAEVVGLRGVCNDECVVVASEREALEKVDFSKKSILFSQTTMDKPTLKRIAAALKERFDQMKPDEADDKFFLYRDTVCKFVSDRETKLRAFAKSNDVVIFVAGRNSSNGKSLYTICKEENERTYFIEDISELDRTLLEGVEKCGITGATSTPQWYLLEVKKKLNEIYSQSGEEA
ncbi:MAG: 4-hydroxy-3-methylbut-2-enyl diphosphate reductase [Chloroflexota bacterium]